MGIKNLKILFFCLFFFCFLPANTNNVSLLTVTGESTLEVRPEQIKLIILVNKEGLTAAEAQEFHKKIAVKVLDIIKQNNIDPAQVQSDNYLILPVYKLTKTQNKVLDKYLASLRITVDLYQTAGLGKLLDEITSAGNTSIEKISYLLKDEQAAKKQAVLLAVQDARTKAETIAQEMNLNLGQPLKVVENSTLDYAGQNTENGLWDTVVSGNIGLGLQNKIVIKTKILVDYEVLPK